MPFSHVQSASGGTAAPSVSSYTMTFGSAVGSGNLVCGAGIFSVPASSPTGITVTDNASPSNTYSVLDTTFDSTNLVTVIGFYNGNVLHGPTVITVAWTSGALTFTGGLAEEFSGNSTTPLDQHNAQVVTGGTTPSSPSVLPANNGDLIFGYCFDELTAQTISPGSGYTTATTFTGSAAPYHYSTLTEYQTQAIAASISATFSTPGSSTYIAGVIAFAALPTLMGQVLL